MSDNNNHIKTYTAEDIDRYLNRQMSAAEMYALEKAALDDPFLAEAIEGYVNMPPVSVKDDIEKMVEALDGKTNTRIVGIGFKKLVWSAAAAVIILLGVATTWYWLHPSTDNSIAQKKSEEKATPAIGPPAAQQDQLKVTADSLLIVPIKEPVTISPPGEKKTAPSSLPVISLSNENAGKVPEQKDESPKEFDKTKDQGQPVEVAKKTEANREEANDVSFKRKATTSAPKEDMAATTVQAENQRSVSGYYFTPRIFTGIITDDNNKPLPFVNISIPNTPTNTYSDAQGNFRLTSADTQLVVQLKSVGFEEKRVTLHSNIPANIVQLRPHENSLNEVVVTGYGTRKKRDMPVAKTVKKEVAEIEEEAEAEPKDGWAAYDVYMMNNSRLPDTNMRPALKGYVELSFTVNKYGILTDFEVERSTCPLCNKEAIRLIKEGPAWKLVSGEKPAKVTLTMYF